MYKKQNIQTWNLDMLQIEFWLCQFHSVLSECSKVISSWTLRGN